MSGIVIVCDIVKVFCSFEGCVIVVTRASRPFHDMLVEFVMMEDRNQRGDETCFLKNKYEHKEARPAV